MTCTAVGRFEGMARRKLDGVERDFLHIRYADGDLFVLSDQIDFVRQYVGGEAPPLNKMGGADFARTKQRVRNELRTIAQELVVLYQRRLHTAGHAFSPDTRGNKKWKPVSRTSRLPTNCRRSSK